MPQHSSDVETGSITPEPLGAREPSVRVERASVSRAKELSRQASTSSRASSEPIESQWGRLSQRFSITSLGSRSSFSSIPPLPTWARSRKIKLSLAGLALCAIASGIVVLTLGTNGDGSPGDTTDQLMEGGEWIESERLSSLLVQRNGHFGSALAICDDRIVVSGIGFDGNVTINETSAVPQAFLYTGDGDWDSELDLESQEDVNAPLLFDSGYGRSVACFGELILVSSPWKRSANSKGAVQVFSVDGLESAVMQPTELLAPAGRNNNSFGWATSHATLGGDDLLVVGAPSFEKESEEHVVYFYRALNLSERTFELVHQVSEKSIPGFGSILASSGNLVAILGSDSPASHASTGPIVVYEMTANNDTVLSMNTISLDVVSQTELSTIHSVALDQDSGLLAVGGFSNTSENGIVCLFNLKYEIQHTTSSSYLADLELLQILKGDPGADERFGSSVAIRDGTVAVGSPLMDSSGVVYLFSTTVESPSEFKPMQKLAIPLISSSSLTEEVFNLPLAFSSAGDVLVVGSPLSSNFDNSPNSTNALLDRAGVAFVFEFTQTPSPTAAPTDAPTKSPTDAPTLSPSVVPTKSPTFAPTNSPTLEPTYSPTLAPTEEPLSGGAIGGIVSAILLALGGIGFWIYRRRNHGMTNSDYFNYPRPSVARFGIYKSRHSTEVSSMSSGSVRSSIRSENPIYDD